MDLFEKNLNTISERKIFPEEKPLVSISCLVYNHENFLRDTLDGFLMQKTTFPVEILIHDDASTDGSPTIIKEYLRRFPSIIKPIFQTENQYSRGIKPGRFNMDRALGKFYALCEGDDYWTDPLKLQKQVNLLEENPDFSMCCGGYIARNIYSGEERTIIQTLSGDEEKKGFQFGIKDLNKTWFTKTLTVLYRRNILNLGDLPDYKYGRDIHLFYHLIMKGNGFYMKEVFGIHNIHLGGINSMNQGRVNSNAAYNCYKELYFFNKNQFTREKALRSTLTLLNYDLYHHYPLNTVKRRLNLLKEAVLLLNNLKEIKWFLSSFISQNFKIWIKGSKTSDSDFRRPPFKGGF